MHFDHQKYIFLKKIEKEKKNKKQNSYNQNNGIFFSLLLQFSILRYC